jgi:hypothetical protein
VDAEYGADDFAVHSVVHAPADVRRELAGELVDSDDSDDEKVRPRVRPTQYMFCFQCLSAQNATAPSPCSVLVTACAL